MNTGIKRKALAIFTVVILTVGILIPSSTVKAASGDTTVYLTKTGECYHASNCSSLRKSKIPTTLQDAVDRGYRPCSKCHPGSLDAASSSSTTSAKTKASVAATTASTTTATVTNDPAVEALKTYKGNTKDFNAYTYYVSNSDLQTSIGAKGDALLKHYKDYGKAEGRVAIASSAAETTSTDSAVEALKTYKGNTKDFNAYTYYINNTDLQTAIGAVGDALLKHFNDYGKAEGRVAK